MKAKLRQPYFIFIIAVSAIGVSLVLYALFTLPSEPNFIHFLLLLFLAATVQFATTSARIGDETGITYAVATTVSLAALPIHGLFSSILIEAFSAVFLWVIKSRRSTTWKRSWEQLFFNLGAGVIAIALAGMAYEYLATSLEAVRVVGVIIPWLVAAIVVDQSNFLLIITIMYLQNPQKTKPLEIWREDLWATQIGILLLAGGGGLLAYAEQTFGWLGIVIFIFPIFLSAYSFRLYLNQMQIHLDNLENIIATRTKELKIANEDLEQLHKEKDAFLAVLTHDMKTPLTVIGMYAELISARPQLLIEKPKMVTLISDSQKTLTEMVNNILDLEKLKTGQQIDLKKEILDLDNLLTYIVEIINIQAQKKEIELNYAAPKNVITINGDPHQLGRVFTNLISNAIKYTPEGGKVTIDVCNNESEVQVQITDTGYGIPADDLPHIFERFKRVTKHKDKALGTGLGLAISKAIVEAHNGEISCTSVEDEGSTFVVTFGRA